MHAVLLPLFSHHNIICLSLFPRRKSADLILRDSFVVFLFSFFLFCFALKLYLKFKLLTFNFLKYCQNTLLNYPRPIVCLLLVAIVFEILLYWILLWYLCLIFGKMLFPKFVSIKPWNNCSEKFCKIHGKTNAMESF